MDTTIEYDQKDVTEYESDTEPSDDKNHGIQGPPRIQINDVTQKESMNSTIVISKNDANESVSNFFFVKSIFCLSITSVDNFV